MSSMTNDSDHRSCGALGEILGIPIMGGMTVVALASRVTPLAPLRVACETRGRAPRQPATSAYDPLHRAGSSPQPLRQAIEPHCRGEGVSGEVLSLADGRDGRRDLPCPFIGQPLEGARLQELPNP